MWTTLVDVPLPTVVKADVNHTIVDRHYRSNQGLAGLIERIIERIAVYCSPLSLTAPTASTIISAASKHTQTPQQPIIIANHQKAQGRQRRDRAQQDGTAEFEHGLGKGRETEQNRIE